jgi:hypothetical protein
MNKHRQDERRLSWNTMSEHWLLVNVSAIANREHAIEWDVTPRKRRLDPRAV